MMTGTEGGYSIVDKSDISPEEIMTLRGMVGWDPDTSERWQECIERSLAIVGARDTDGQLIGMGRLVGDVRHAVLCDLAVVPEHRGQGIGSMILDERIRIADEMDVAYLYAELAADNPLARKYQDLGFVATGNGLFRAR
jgi:ribosomal protein S18 acetylase RimI-like enzyme